MAGRAGARRTDPAGPGEPFDAFARALSETRSRREMLRVVAGSLLGGVVATLGFRSEAEASLLCNPKITPCKQLFQGVCTPCTDLGKLCDPDGTCVYSCQGCTHPSPGNVSCLPGCGEGFCCNNAERICQPANRRCMTTNSSGQCVTCQQAGTTCNPDGTCAEVNCTGCTHLNPTTHLCVQGCSAGNCCNGTTCVATPRCSTTDNTGHCVTCAAVGTCCKSDGTCAAAGGCQGADANGNCAPCQSLARSVGGQSISLCCDRNNGSVCVVPAETCACSACSNGTCQTCKQTSTQQNPTCCFNPSDAGGICILVSQQPNGGRCVSADGSCGCTTAGQCCNTATGQCVTSASLCPAPGCSFGTGAGTCQCGCPSGQTCNAQTKTCAACGALNQPCCTGSTCNTAAGLTCQGGICKQLTCLNAACGGANNGCGSSSVPNQCDPCANNGTVSCVCSNLTSSSGTCIAATPLGGACAANGNQTADGVCQGAFSVNGTNTCFGQGAACTSDATCCTFCNPTTGTCTAGYCDKGSNTVGQCNFACGGAGQPCCPGSFCASGLTCTSNGQTPAAFFCLSSACGNSGQPCCGGFGPGGRQGTCYTGLLCTSGTCM